MEELKKCHKKCRDLDNQLVETYACLEWIEMALDGKELGDFALSFPVVRRVYELKRSKSQ